MKQRGSTLPYSKVFLIFYISPSIFNKDVDGELIYTLAKNIDDSLSLVSFTNNESLLMMTYIMNNGEFYVIDTINDKYLQISSNITLSNIKSSFESHLISGKRKEGQSTISIFNPFDDQFETKTFTYTYSFYSWESYQNGKQYLGYVFENNEIFYVLPSESGMRIQYEYTETCGQNHGSCDGNQFCILNYGQTSSIDRFICSNYLFNIGISGEDGEEGNQGPRGSKGDSGDIGENGEIGLKGENKNNWSSKNAQKFLILFTIVSLFVIMGIFLLRPYFGYPKFFILKENI